MWVRTSGFSSAHAVWMLLLQVIGHVFFDVDMMGMWKVLQLDAGWLEKSIM